MQVTETTLILCLVLSVVAIILLSVYINRVVKQAPKQKLAGAALPSNTQPVIPLAWSSETGTYNITFQVGVDTITAAFDTGSAQFIVATDNCTTCTGAAYVPTKSPTAKAILNTSDSLCRLTKYYGSQTDTIQMYSDTVSIPRIFAGTCTGAVTGSPTQPAPIVIQDFPVGGIMTNSGNTSTNVFGMSGVQCVTRAQNGQYLMPTCQVTESPQFISSLIESFSIESAKKSVPMIWSIKFAPIRDNGAVVSFGSLPYACKVRVAYTPAVSVLPNTTSALASTPWRYYVIEVESATTYIGEVPLPNFPKYLMIDTGTTQFEIPNTTSAVTLQSQGLVITLANSNGSKLFWTGTDNDLFANMPDSLASNFSSDHQVGILGCFAMLGRYIEFTFGSPRMIGFA